MNEEYSKDFFWDTYKKLPEDLKEALFSDKNNEVINHICSQSGLNEEQSAIVAKFTGRVLMGLLPLDEFPITIELELSISQDLASQINRQIYISVFKHLRVSLNKINDTNSHYKDQFTSDSDGKEEELRRREEAMHPKPITKPSIPVSAPKPSNIVFPPKETKAEETMSTGLEKIKEPKDPPFSYNEPSIDIPKKGVDNNAPINPSVEELEPLKETLPDGSPSVPDIPSRSAFEQELKKEGVPFPDIPMSFEADSIPTVAIDEIKNQTSPSPAVEKTSIEESPTIKTPEAPKILTSLPNPETPKATNNISKSFSTPQTLGQKGEDPYKEMPI
jgi:hypothetical protein